MSADYRCVASSIVLCFVVFEKPYVMTGVLIAVLPTLVGYVLGDSIYNCDWCDDAGS